MQDILEIILERIREAADPDKIILFGSRSRGDRKMAAAGPAL
ncbi:hypothetical protein [Thermanaeromonas sp.]|nr:hypothetical protein [Thermanaeromonas sp.]